MLFLFAPYASKDFRNPNAVSRLGLAHALATRAELTIDPVAALTVDKAIHGQHAYCDKAPGMSFLCVPAVFAADRIADGLGYSEQLVSPRTGKLMARYTLCAYACLLASSAWLWALAAVFFGRALRAAGGQPRAAHLLTLFLAFGTPPLLWSTTLFGHAAASALLFLPFADYWLLRRAPTVRRGHWLLYGLSLAMSVLVEFTALPAALLLTGFLLWSERDLPTLPSVPRRALLLLSGALAPMLTLLLYNAQAFGHPFKLGYAAVQGFEGMQTGFFGISPPNVETAHAVIFGASRGLVRLSPILLVAFVACFVVLFAGASARFDVPRAQPLQRSAALLALAITAYYVCLNAGYYYWDGGWSTGPRHITPIAPFLMFALGLAFQQLRQRALRGVVCLTGLVSMLIVTTCALVRVTIPSDGAPMLTGHILPRLLLGRVTLLPGRIGVPFHIAYLFAILAIAIAGAFFVRGPKLSRKDE